MGKEAGSKSLDSFKKIWEMTWSEKPTPVYSDNQQFGRSLVFFNFTLAEIAQYLPELASDYRLNIMEVHQGVEIATLQVQIEDEIAALIDQQRLNKDALMQLIVKQIRKLMILPAYTDFMLQEEIAYLLETVREHEDEGKPVENWIFAEYFEEDGQTRHHFRQRALLNQILAQDTSRAN
ncbi:MAG TPA: hypothetical protein VD999_03685 [Vitreimonas sp.]|nr:hypothetical protein [Vitreimonas sp.]